MEGGARIAGGERAGGERAGEADWLSIRLAIYADHAMVIVTFLFFEDTFANTGEVPFEDECTTDPLPLDYTVVLLKGLPKQNRCN